MCEIKWVWVCAWGECVNANILRIWNYFNWSENVSLGLCLSWNSFEMFATSCERNFSILVNWMFLPFIISNYRQNAHALSQFYHHFQPRPTWKTCTALNPIIEICAWSEKVMANKRWKFASKKGHKQREET